MSHTGFRYWLENSGEDYSQMSSKKEVKSLQEQLKGVQQQLADLHSQVMCLTEICSPQNVNAHQSRLASNSQNLDLSTMDEDCYYVNVTPFAQNHHNLTYTIQRTVSDLLMCSMSPLPPAPSDQSNLSSFDLSRGDSTESLPSVCISDISHIPTVANSWGNGQMNYSVTDIVAALHPSPELCPPQNTPASTSNNTYMEISDSHMLPCVRRLFPESSTKVERDLFTGCNQEIHCSPETRRTVRRSLTMSCKNNPSKECTKLKSYSKDVLFRRCSTRRSLKMPKRAKRSAGCNQEVFSPHREDTKTCSRRTKERPPCIGEEIPSLGQKRKHADTTYQSLQHFDMEESYSPAVYESIKETSPSDVTTSSDITAFIDAPLCAQAVTKKTKSSKRKSISKELRRFGKNIQKFGAKKLKLETLAVL